MVCRKDDVGGSADSGAPTSDGGGAPPPLGDGGVDTQAPTVSITAPADNATVQASTKVVVQAQDNRGVTRVDLLVDSALLASQNATPYEFAISLQPGTHQVTAVAHDKAG
ncbi:MAG: hypothetical protein JRI55_33410, partial [Deltaproteobacteria bacterium]|nr:hypothetical protein [Deltaproteobacteria bacterium]